MLYSIDGVSYNYSEGMIYKNDDVIKLTKKQKELLNYFIDHPKKILTKQKIMEDVWGRIITENSVDQLISTLRGYIEKNPAKPKLLITHFGKGLSFEGKVEEEKENVLEGSRSGNEKKRRFFVPLLLSFILVGVVLWWINSTTQSTQPSPNQLAENKAELVSKMLVLPISFEGDEISQIEQKGMFEVLKSTFTNTTTEGKVVFDNTSVTTEQAIEKHWRLEKNLFVVYAKVLKEGDHYKAIIELSDGVRTLEKKQISSTNLNDLLNEQINYIATISAGKSNKASKTMEQSPSLRYIEAIGYKEKGNLEKAKSLIEEILLEHGDYSQARLTLAEILFALKEYDQSLSQLQTLKATNAYKTMGTEIELNSAKIHLINHDYQKIVDELIDFQSNNLGINPIKKAKIRQMMGLAYMRLFESKKSLQNYKSSIKDIDENLNPLLFAKSYYGQGRAQIQNAIDDKVYNIFEKSYQYAKLAGNIHYQVLSLNEMAGMLFSKYKWEKAIKIQKQALELMELDNNPEGSAKGYGTLAGILNQQGFFKQAKEVNEMLGQKAKELQSDLLQLQYLHFDAIIAINMFNWEHAQNQIDAQLELAIKTKNIGLQLDNAFIDFELRLLKKDTDNFLTIWNERSALIKNNGLERYQIYLDLYLARYYKAINNDKKAIALIHTITEKALVSNDFKIIVDAHNNLAEIYFKTDPKQSLIILNNLEQYNPHPNPYLDLKAKALHLLGNDIEALSILNQAKKVYHESWTTEIQALYEEVQQAVNEK